MIDKKVYKIRDTGKVEEMEDSVKIPFDKASVSMDITEGFNMNLSQARFQVKFLI